MNKKEAHPNDKNNNDFYYEIDFNYLNTILHGDKNDINEFLKHAIKDIRIIKEQFIRSVKNKDREQFDQGIHKTKWIFKMLGVNEIKHLRDCQAIIHNDDSTEKDWSLVCEKCVIIFDQVLMSIEKQTYQ